MQTQHNVALAVTYHWERINSQEVRFMHLLGEDEYVRDDDNDDSVSASSGDDDDGSKDRKNDSEDEHRRRRR